LRKTNFTDFAAAYDNFQNTFYTLILDVQLCFRRFPIDGLAVSGGRNK